ncbi:MAG: hypothetical protein ACI8W3_002249 [Myxococcota bacterium]|jgi:hypothetical protein
MQIDIPAVKKEHVGFEFDEATFEIRSEKLVAYATACGERETRFIDPSDANFRAVPNYASSFHGRRNLPENFPADLNRSFDAGKCCESLAPIRPGDTITGRSHIHDIYEKTGRSGPMMFVVHRMEFTNQDDTQVAIVDWRLVMRLGEM